VLYCINNGLRGIGMPEISRFYGIIITMFFRDHPPPHFHARYGESVALISLDDFRILKGSLPPKALSLVMEWAATRKSDLSAAWATIQRGGRARVEPLQ
jgi:hypothetical protein